MSNNIFQFLDKQYPAWREGKTLLIADENLSEGFVQLKKQDILEVLTNRFDIFQEAKQYYATIYFNDFDFSRLESKYQLIIYRISKERPLCHHILNKCGQHIEEGGRLFISGKKNEGIKGYHQKLTSKLGYNGRLIKSGEWYSALLTHDKAIKADNLDDKDYQALRPLKIQDYSFYSKPGIYGWNKIDDGSEILISAIIEDLAKGHRSNCSLLDLGCGYGYLSMVLLEWNQQQEAPLFNSITATDNNVAAISACKKNLESFAIEKTIEADDCAQSISDSFDFIVCNPPFHRGFDTERSLTEKFLQSVKRLLKKDGIAYFVVNRFIPLEKKALDYFKTTSEISKTTSFKVIKCML